MSKIIYSANDRTPYTYLIGWSVLDVWYYGVRYGKRCHPSDLWTKYFTSSSYVKRFRELHGEPDIIEIRKIFNDAKSACLWEDKVMHRMNIVGSSRWLNRNNSSYLYVNDSLIKKAAETRRKRVYKKQVAWNKGLSKETDSRMLAISKKTKGRICSESHKINMRKSKSDTSKMGRYVRSEETRTKIREANSNLVIDKVKCQFCQSPKSVGKRHEKHEASCIMNPMNAAFCAVCSSQLTYRGKEACSVSCANKLRSKRKQFI